MLLSILELHDESKSEEGHRPAGGIGHIPRDAHRGNAGAENETIPQVRRAVEPVAQPPARRNARQRAAPYDDPAPGHDEITSLKDLPSVDRAHGRDGGRPGDRPRVRDATIVVVETSGDGFASRPSGPCGARRSLRSLRASGAGGTGGAGDSLRSRGARGAVGAVGPVDSGDS